MKGEIAITGRNSKDRWGTGYQNPAPCVRPAQVAPEFGTRFSVFIDTEEDFDWNAPFNRTNHGLASVANLENCQRFFAQASVKPLYLVDYPIVQCDAAVDQLGPHVESGDRKSVV